MHQGQGMGLSLREMGETGGSPTATLAEPQMPPHNHAVSVSDRPADLASGASAYWASTDDLYSAAADPAVVMARETLAPSGGGQPHNNLPPQLVMNFCIALQGIYPARS